MSEFRLWEGRISGVLALAFGAMCLAGVLCFRFPEALTTPQLRAVYSVSAMRGLLAFFLTLTLLLAATSFALSRRKALSLAGFALAALATALGGAGVAVPDAVETRVHLGLDWFLLDLLAIGLVFVPYERAFALRAEQKVFRGQWPTDLAYFGMSHLLIQGTSLLILAPSVLVGARLAVPALQALTRAQPAWLQLLEIVAVADLAQYWIHRAFHRLPPLWRFHAVHHSAKEMDWLAGSRLHLLDAVVTRGLVLLPLFVLGFDRGPLTAYLVLVAFWATLIHANARFELRPLREILATPPFHHWHHALEPEAVDKNFAVHLPLYDRLFGTHYLPDRWPSAYGLPGDPVPDGYLAQLSYPVKG